MWQSWVETEHYSIAYFPHVIMFEVLLRRTSIKVEAHILCGCKTPGTSMQRIWAPPLMEVLCYNNLNTATSKIRNEIMLNFYQELPHIFRVPIVFETCIFSHTLRADMDMAMGQLQSYQSLSSYVYPRILTIQLTISISAWWMPML